MKGRVRHAILEQVLLGAAGLSYFLGFFACSFVGGRLLPLGIGTIETLPTTCSNSAAKGNWLLLATHADPENNNAHHELDTDMSIDRCGLRVMPT